MSLYRRYMTNGSWSRFPFSHHVTRNLCVVGTAWAKCPVVCRFACPPTSLPRRGSLSPSLPVDKQSSCMCTRYTPPIIPTLVMNVSFSLLLRTRKSGWHVHYQVHLSARARLSKWQLPCLELLPRYGLCDCVPTSCDSISLIAREMFSWESVHSIFPFRPTRNRASPRGSM